MPALQSPYPLLLNADVGEGFDHDHSIIEIVDIANIACGAHAGDRQTILKTLDSIQHFNKYTFAHLGYEDKANFGRKSVQMDKQSFTDNVHKQLDALFSAANEVGADILGVKPHGALYHDTSTHSSVGQRLIDACLAYQSSFFKERLIIIAQAHSAFYSLVQQANLPVLAEAFIDRTYGADKTLLPRTLPEATITEPGDASDQAYELSHLQQVTSLDGSKIRIKADTLCLHGDSSAALNIARSVSARLRSRIDSTT